jgi:alpha-D-ribose 1-methylphosphonate 5-triphosphate synthase subunit PhnG
MSGGRDWSRSGVMGTAARATLDELRSLVAPEPDDVVDLRAPEVGLVLVRGRIGGDGRPFNLGEATVTRAAVRLPTGEVGQAHVLGREPERARLGALVDALWQVPARRDEIERGLRGVRERIEAQAELRRRRTAATRVDFFTVARGD